MSSLSQEKRTFLQSRLMPAAVLFFKQALKVVSVAQKLKLNESSCNSASVPSSLVDTGVDADIILFVTTYPIPVDNVLAWAAPCFASDSDNR